METRARTRTRAHQPESAKERGAAPTPLGPRQLKDIAQERKKSRKKNGESRGMVLRHFRFGVAGLE